MRVRYRSWTRVVPALLAASILGLAFGPAAAEPDLILVNARAFTADPDRPWAEAASVEDGRFTAVGTTAEIQRLSGPRTRVVDAGGRLVTPGLTEAHAHVGPDLPGRRLAFEGPPFPGRDADGVLAVTRQAADGQGGWLVVEAGMSVFNDSRDWRRALDEAAPANPVIVRGCCGHGTLMNSRALIALGIDESLADPVGGWWGRDGDGRLNGRAFEAAEILVIRRLFGARDAAAIADGYGAAEALYATWGVTAIHQMSHDLTLGDAFGGLAQLSPRLKWTVYGWGLPDASVGEVWREVDALAPSPTRHVRLGGTKWILDGTPLERGAVMADDYADRPGWRGRSNYTADQLVDILRGALASDRQLAVHVSGDGEARRLIEAMRALAPDAEWRRHRVRIEHGDGVSGSLLADARALGVVIIQNPLHTAPSPVEDGVTFHVARYGPARMATMMPLRSVVDSGTSFALGSDAGGPAMNPFLNMMLAIAYPLRPEEALSREQALLAYTAGGAVAAREDGERGRIAPGLAADLAILSQDVLTAPLDSLPGTVSLLTLVDGEPVHAAGPYADLAPKP